jgi:hypothetical protein
MRIFLNGSYLRFQVTLHAFNGVQVLVVVDYGSLIRNVKGYFPIFMYNLYDSLRRSMADCEFIKDIWVMIRKIRNYQSIVD